MNVVIDDFVSDAAWGVFDEILPLTKDFEWKTDVVSKDDRSEQRNQIDESPRRVWYLNWAILDEPARNKVVELFHRAKGRYDTFLHTDRDDYETSLAECSITAVGGETTTQLIKSYYSTTSETWDEDKKDIVPGTIFAPVVKIDGVTKTEDTHFTLDDTTGIIDWTGGSAPNGALSTGEVVTANYRFYFRVRFGGDVYRDIQNKRGLWNARDLHLMEVIPSA